MSWKCLTDAIHTDMMSPTQIKNLTYVFTSLMASEKNGWTDLDEYMVLLEWLDSDQLYRECDALYSIHKNEKMGCPYIHSEGTICFVANVLEAVEAILELYRETNNLHVKNRYVLCNYLALCQDQQILIMSESSAI